MSSLKSLYQNNKSGATIGKYLKSSAPDTIGDGIESQAHLKALVNKNDYFLPPIDYAVPENFVKFGSAEKYYQNAFEYIAANYPYDGSGLEKTNFYNDINPLEKYMLEVKYPRSTGFVSIGAPYTLAGTNASKYDEVSTANYIQAKGGPHVNTKFDVLKDRTSNLEFGGANGTTVEFFMKKDTLINPNGISETSRNMAIFDLTNGVETANSGSEDYGRLRIAIHSGSETQFHVTMLSGTNGFLETPVPSTADQITISDGTWRNFSFVFDTSKQPASVDFYVNGTCIETGITASAAVDIDGAKLIGLVTGTMIGNVGALRQEPSTFGSIPEGSGKLSASLDEFRFWKKTRNAEEVGRYWFTNVEGGSDKHDANVSLGVYYKFNEGITETSSIDQTMLDYSGRISNGTYVNYADASSHARNTGSAIDQLEIESITERGDPIIRTNNPTYLSTKSIYEQSGSVYDLTNNSRLLNYLPNWIIEEDENGEGELINLTQIISGYFDTLYNQITALKKIKYMDYVSGSLTDSIDEFPYNDRLVDNLGINTPELFQNSDVLAQFLKRDEQINFDQQLVDVKNSIYKNVYNNLNFILKSKGNQKAVRNFIRCLGVSEDILALNVYGDQTDFELTSNYESSVITKRYIDFTALRNVSDSEAVVYQYYDSSNPNSYGLINASTEIEEYAFTLQGDIIFPNKDQQDKLPFNVPQVVSSSLFGFHTPDDTSPTSVDLTWAAATNDYGLQVYAVKSPGEYAEITSPDFKVKDAYFVVQNRAGDVLLQSDIYRNVYDNKRWNFSLSVRPKRYPFADGVTGSSVVLNGYELEFYGTNYDAGVKDNSFTLSSDISYLSGSSTVGLAKRIYTGAHRNNFTGTTLTSTDVKASSIRYWTDYISPTVADLQARELNTHGSLHPSRNSYLFQTASANVYIPNIQTLALNWEFSEVTGSDASGRFVAADASSGSVGTDYISTYQGGVFSDINLRQHTGLGNFFTALSKPSRKNYSYASKLVPPEYINSSEMVKVLSTDDQVFKTFKKPSNTFFAIEKSMYRSISTRMLHLFASIKDFNNLIGEPVNQYRMNYKRMEKIREIFFRKVQNEIPDLQKYLDYYKWLDYAMTQMLDQLMPASARYAPDTRNVIESHTLERNKIKYAPPILCEPRRGSNRLAIGDIAGNVGGDNELIGVGGVPGNEELPPQGRVGNGRPEDEGIGGEAPPPQGRGQQGQDQQELEDAGKKADPNAQNEEDFQRNFQWPP